MMSFGVAQSLLGEQEGAEVTGHIGPLSFADNVLGFADYDAEASEMDNTSDEHK